MRFKLDYNKEKNLLLKRTRGIGFDDIEEAIDAGNLLDLIKHPNEKKYLHQRILIVKVKDYVYAVPCVYNKSKSELFLKTLYPDRKLTKSYLKNYGKAEK